jgi:hypothetical protein
VVDHAGVVRRVGAKLVSALRDQELGFLCELVSLPVCHSGEVRGCHRPQTVISSSPRASRPVAAAARAMPDLAALIFSAYCSGIRVDFQPPACVIAAKSMSSAERSCAAPTLVECPLTSATNLSGMPTHCATLLKIGAMLPGCRPPNLFPTNQPRKYRPLADLRMLEPDLQPLDRLVREIHRPPLTLGVGLASTDKRLSRPVRARIRCPAPRAPPVRCAAPTFRRQRRGARSPLPALRINCLISSQPNARAGACRADVSRPIFFSANRTASLEQGLNNPAPM